MTLTLNLGVVDIPYGDAYAPRTRRKGSSASSGSKSTGDIAEILEDKYHIMEIFFETNRDFVLKSMDDIFVGHLTNMLAGVGAPKDATSGDLFRPAMEKIGTAFRDFITQKKLDGVGVPGVPTQASLTGVSHSFARPYQKRAPRPSFVDTGLYRRSFEAWVDVS